jgi:flagellar basal-body rod protein FlgC
MDGYDITASALTAQRLRMDIISSNLANVNTTRKSDGTIGAYRRRNVSFAPIMQQSQSQFAPGNMRPSELGSPSSAGDLAMQGSPNGSNSQAMLHGYISNQSQAVSGVQVMGISEDKETPMRMVFDPSNPDANEKGYVEMPNINTVTEMVDMISASRAYEANVTALQSMKSMNQAALEL